MNVDYSALEDNIVSGALRAELEAELTIGFHAIRMTGERLPVATHYASQIAEIIARGAPSPMRPELAYQVYLEVLAACESARATVLGEGE